MLDLGSGSGRDCFILSKLVGEDGYVLGVDMTDEQLGVAQKHVQYHTDKFGYSKPNVEFKKGYIERLEDLGLEENSFDIVVSNCVVNLSPDKKSVLSGVYRLLKPGGELYFSDVYSDRRVPVHLTQHKVLWGECLSGALYKNDFVRLAKSVGFLDPRLVSNDIITISNSELETLVGNIKFFSLTYRLFKIEELEYDCEDYGQAVMYNGGIHSCANAYVLDSDHTFEAKKVVSVCGNTLVMLTNTRFAPYFQVSGDGVVHFGKFKCAMEKGHKSRSGNGNAEKKSCC